MDVISIELLLGGQIVSSLREPLVTSLAMSISRHNDVRFRKES